MTPTALLPTRMVEKVWGRDRLPPPFAAPPGQRIGEIWFEPPAALDAVLAKYLFTSEKLSVQVHPSDANAPAGERGKEECWLVLAADPGASLAIGFGAPVSAEAMRRAALDGSIEALLAWHPVQAGDFFYLPAGTVHAIGPGLSLVEIQQNSDCTYRLYDYGRPRELHLDQAIAVAEGRAHDPALRRRIDLGAPAMLVEGPHFRLDYCVSVPTAEVTARYAGPLLLLPIAGHLAIEGEPIAPGSCGLAGAIDAIEFGAGSRALIAQGV